MQERRAVAMAEAESQPDPQLLVDTAKTSWQVLHVNSAAREIVGDVSEGSEPRSLWDMFTATQMVSCVCCFCCEERLSRVHPLLACICGFEYILQQSTSEHPV